VTDPTPVRVPDLNAASQRPTITNASHAIVTKTNRIDRMPRNELDGTVRSRASAETAKLAEETGLGGSSGVHGVMPPYIVRQTSYD